MITEHKKNHNLSTDIYPAEEYEEWIQWTLIGNYLFNINTVIIIKYS